MTTGDLFSQDEFEQLAMKQADVRLWRQWINKKTASDLFQHLCHSLTWSQPIITIAGVQRLTPRWQCWMGESIANYTYSGVQFRPVPWDQKLLAIKNNLETLCSTGFNSVLVNWYKTEQHSVSWHADDEPELGCNPVIASISLGETRRFLMRPKIRNPGDRSQSIELHSGDLLLMAGPTQRNWQHCLPKANHHCDGRINLTFRNIG